MEHVLQLMTRDNFEESHRNLSNLASEGILTCMRTKTLKLLQYGEYQTLPLWLNMCDEMKKITAHGRVVVAVPGDLMVRTDESLIKIVVQNLVSNAMSHGRRDGPIKIDLHVDSGRVVIRVINEPGDDHESVTTHGLASPPPNQFEDFLKRPGENAASGNSHSQGLGLRGVKQCLDSLGASMGLFFHPQQVVAEVTLTDEFKFRAKITFDEQSRPLVACLDDSVVQRKVLQRMLSRTKAGAASFVAGGSIEEVRAFPEQVMNSPQLVTHCIIDQNLDDPAGLQQSILGSSIVQQLKALGYTGRCLIRSANDSPTCLALYRGCGADGFMSKSGLSPATFVEALTGQTWANDAAPVIA
jgi:anti-sigma regulatory factor (Ser/Thr protein kinase)